jgi:hypothetical protein
MRWEQGRSTIDRMLSDREMERVQPSAGNATAMISLARQQAATASRLADQDPVSAVSVLYDAARRALTAILENEGLRPTSKGGHIAVLEAVRAQLDPPMGKVLRPFERLRRLRNNLEYGVVAASVPDADDIGRDVPRVTDMIDLAERVIQEMSPY